MTSQTQSEQFESIPDEVKEKLSEIADHNDFTHETIMPLYKEVIQSMTDDLPLYCLNYLIIEIGGTKEGPAEDLDMNTNRSLDALRQHRHIIEVNQQAQQKKAD